MTRCVCTALNALSSCTTPNEFIHSPSSCDAPCSMGLTPTDDAFKIPRWIQPRKNWLISRMIPPPTTNSTRNPICLCSNRIPKPVTMPTLGTALVRLLQPGRVASSLQGTALSLLPRPIDHVPMRPRIAGMVSSGVEIQSRLTTRPVMLELAASDPHKVEVAVDSLGWVTITALAATLPF